MTNEQFEQSVRRAIRNILNTEAWLKDNRQDEMWVDVLQASAYHYMELESLIFNPSHN